MADVWSPLDDSHGFQFGNEEIKGWLYADDVFLVSATPAGLQIQRDLLGDALKQNELSLIL